MKGQRFRLKFMFWLDANKSDEYELAETIEALKQERSFARTIRDGIRLIVSLRQRQTDVLFELFPFLESEIAKPDVVGSSNHLANRLDRIEQLLESTGQPPTVSGPKPMAVAQVTAPTFEDDEEDIELEFKPSTSSNASSVDNFLSSISSFT